MNAKNKRTCRQLAEPLLPRRIPYLQRYPLIVEHYFGRDVVHSAACWLVVLLATLSPGRTLWSTCGPC